ncbi:hypothetical protein TUBRATIS_006710 [Tubulinosema ratisbonensis]|uniref:Uncharacterized protein n=1 Tax=Tubulinosema ratisbonensis TaxID=291195 RepID=A0A437ANW3_9MICR|nr:hypothetical protein TUBRATIS_006710 [Tubulinosema ratisbonensis]
MYYKKLKNTSNIHRPLIEDFQNRLNLIDINNYKNKYCRILKIVQDSRGSNELVARSSEQTNDVFKFIINPNKNLGTFFNESEEFYIKRTNKDSSQIYDPNKLKTNFTFDIELSPAMELISEFRVPMQQTTIFEYHKNKFAKLYKGYIKNMKILFDFIHDLNLFMQGLNYDDLYRLKSVAKPSEDDIFFNEIQETFKFNSMLKILNNLQSSTEILLDFVRTMLTKKNRFFDRYRAEFLANKMIELNQVYKFKYKAVKHILCKVKSLYDLYFLMEISQTNEILNEKNKIELFVNFYKREYFSFLSAKITVLLLREDALRRFYSKIDFRSSDIYNIYYDELENFIKFFNNLENKITRILPNKLIKCLLRLRNKQYHLSNLFILLIKEVNLLKKIRSDFILKLNDDLRNITFYYSVFKLDEVEKLISNPFKFHKIPLERYNLYNLYSFLFQTIIMKYEARVFAINKILKCLFETYSKENYKFLLILTLKYN